MIKAFIASYLAFPTEQGKGLLLATTGHFTRN